MSSLTVYSTEPATKGKVVLHTTIGPLDVELWSKEAPLTCRNFLQLCLEGYYDGVIFHRIIKEFMAQTGDPTGTGTGGESIYDENDFKDEFHGRLRYTHRGLLGMASCGPNTNRSQFFITLDQCPWIDNKHTIFGKVTGHSMYNLPRLNEQETDADDKPLYPPRIERVEVLYEPFDDIVPRARAAPVVEAPKKKRKEKKNLSLLSFGDEAAEEEAAAATAPQQGLRSHDALDDPRLSRKEAVDASALAAKLQKREAKSEAEAAFKAKAAPKALPGEPTEDADGFEERMRRQMQLRRQRQAAAAAGEGEAAGGRGGEEEEGEKEGRAVADDSAVAASEYHRLRQQLAREKAAAEATEATVANGGGGGARVSGWKWRGKGGKDDYDDDDDEEEDEEAGGSILEQRRAKFLKKKMESRMLTKKQRQAATLERLGAFKSSLRAEGGAGRGEESDWKEHKLEFTRERREAESASRYDSHDPLKHGAEAKRVEDKIKARARIVQSMKAGFADE